MQVFWQKMALLLSLYSHPIHFLSCGFQSHGCFICVCVVLWSQHYVLLSASCQHPGTCDQTCFHFSHLAFSEWPKVACDV